MPDLLVVIHDAAGEGVAATKNQGLAALMADPTIDHLFLADDDCWPITDDWAAPYVNDAEPHLMHCWGKSRLLSDDGHYTTWKHPRGVLLYAERRVVETVGGMHLEFGRWGGEHVEWSRRIHAAGLTAHRYADLSAARRGIWHALDYVRSVPSTVTNAERAASEANRHEMYRRFRGSAEFVEYRTTGGRQRMARHREKPTPLATACSSDHASTEA